MHGCGHACFVRRMKKGPWLLAAVGVGVGGTQVTRRCAHTDRQAGSPHTASGIGGECGCGDSWLMHTRHAQKSQTQGDIRVGAQGDGISIASTSASSVEGEQLTLAQSPPRCKPSATGLPVSRPGIGTGCTQMPTGAQIRTAQYRGYPQLVSGGTCREAAISDASWEITVTSGIPLQC